MRPSLTSIGLGLFFFFVGSSMWSMYSVWHAPKCDPSSQEMCYKSFLNDNPILDLLVYVNDNSRSGKLDLVLHLKEIDYKIPFEKDVTIKVPEAVKKNGTIFIHTLLLPQKNTKRYSVNDFNNLVNSEDVSYVKGRLTKYAVPQSNTYNLLNEEGTDRPREDKPVTHVRSRYAITACTEQLNIPHSMVPNEIIRSFHLNSKRQFLPIITQDFLNMRLKDLVEITPESNTLTFTYIYSPISLGKMRFYMQMETSLRSFLDMGFTEKDMDEVKGMFSDANLYLLCLTLVVGSVHLAFDFLSFKNDVTFWRTQKSMAGLSTRSVLWRAFSQVVVFVFLLDEGTSLLVLIPAGIATLIELWKVTKVFKTNLAFSWKGIKFHTKAESRAEAETRKYDEECMKYLIYVLYPLCLGAAFYSLYYQSHKSWYSWTLNSLVNGVYAFGFLFMLPQLFINYRLKSVAALPWKVFTYKAFNTFIDDIFAFIITMPTAHRVACLRDDVVFLIYLYQRWLYPVDPSRTEGISEEVKQDIDEKKNK